jgi:hypothetical protein
MKYKLTLTQNTTYAEVGQKNPLRWKTLLRAGDSFKDQSGWIKCKDFYNDTVAFFKEGSVFSIWSYQNKIEKNDEGVYFLLKYISDQKAFAENIAVFNKRLKKDLGCTVDIIDADKDEAIILIPNELWESTYRISMVTMVIRLGNYGYIHKNWEDFWNTDSPSYRHENAFTEDAKDNARKYGFKEPEGFEGYWWYCGPQHNSKVIKKQTGGTIHNNGVSNWSMFIKKAMAEGAKAQV